MGESTQGRGQINIRNSTICANYRLLPPNEAKGSPCTPQFSAKWNSHGKRASPGRVNARQEDLTGFSLYCIEHHSIRDVQIFFYNYNSAPARVRLEARFFSHC